MLFFVLLPEAQASGCRGCFAVGLSRVDSRLHQGSENGSEADHEEAVAQAGLR